MLQKKILIKLLCKHEDKKNSKYNVSLCDFLIPMGTYLTLLSVYQ